MAIIDIDSSQAKQLIAQSCLAFGVFDGLHLGHRKMIDAMKEYAQTHGLLSGALTFSIDPDEVFRKQSLKKLSSNKQRLEALDAYGVDNVFVIPFSKDYAQLLPLEFLDSTFAGNEPRAIFVGTNFRFGASASGTIETLKQWADEYHIEVFPIELCQHEGKTVSASRIRLLLTDAKIAQANELLGRRYVFSGEVVKGKGYGAKLGFATANINETDSPVILPEGVYGGVVSIDNKEYRTAISIGVSPTFNEFDNAAIEVHVIDFEGDLVGKTITVAPLYYIRPMIRFDSKDELVKTVSENIDWIAHRMVIL